MILLFVTVEKVMFTDQKRTEYTCQCFNHKLIICYDFIRNNVQVLVENLHKITPSLYINIH